jgi:hypothetical protein
MSKGRPEPFRYSLQMRQKSNQQDAISTFFVPVAELADIVESSNRLFVGDLLCLIQ